MSTVIGPASGPDSPPQPRVNIVRYLYLQANGEWGNVFSSDVIAMLDGLAARGEPFPEIYRDNPDYGQILPDPPAWYSSGSSGETQPTPPPWTQPSAPVLYVEPLTDPGDIAAGVASLQKIGATQTQIDTWLTNPVPLNESTLRSMRRYGPGYIDSFLANNSTMLAGVGQIQASMTLNDTAGVDKMIKSWEKENTNPDLIPGINSVKDAVSNAKAALSKVKVDAFTTIAVLAAGQRIMSEMSSSASVNPSEKIDRVRKELKGLKPISSIEASMPRPQDLSDVTLSGAEAAANDVRGAAERISKIMDEEKSYVKDLALVKFIHSPNMSVDVRKLTTDLTGILPNFAIMATLAKNSKPAAPIEKVEGRTNVAAAGKFLEPDPKELAIIEENMIKSSPILMAAIKDEFGDIASLSQVNLKSISGGLNSTPAIEEEIAKIRKTLEAPQLRQIDPASIDNTNAAEMGKDYDTNLKARGSMYTFSQLMEYKILREKDLIPYMYKITWAKMRVAEQYQKTLSAAAPDLMAAKNNIMSGGEVDPSAFFKAAMKSLNDKSVTDSANSIKEFNSAADTITEYMSSLTMFWDKHTFTYFREFPSENDLSKIWPPVPSNLGDAINSINTQITALADKGIVYPAGLA